MNMQLLMARARINHTSAPPSGGDPYWANVISLLHFDTTLNPDIYHDETGRVWTNTGTALVSDSTVKKFGGASAAFSGTPAVRSPGGTGIDLGTGDFTIEAWTYITDASTASRYLFDVGSNGLTIGPNSNVAGNWNGYTGSISTTLYSNGPARTVGVWKHAALERASGVVTGYLDGTAWGTASTSPNSTGVMTEIGGYGGDTRFPWAGNMAEFRITRGVARYNGNFAVPTAAFPNHT